MKRNLKQNWPTLHGKGRNVAGVSSWVAHRVKRLPSYSEILEEWDRMFKIKSSTEVYLFKFAFRLHFLVTLKDVDLATHKQEIRSKLKDDWTIFSMEIKS